jgi:hypothetical protein
MQKKTEKMLEIQKVMLKNLILIRHFGLNHHFLTNLNNLHSIYFVDENTNSLQKTERKIFGKCQSYAHLNYGCHLGHQTPS